MKENKTGRWLIADIKSDPGAIKVARCITKTGCLETWRIVDIIESYCS